MSSSPALLAKSVSVALHMCEVEYKFGHFARFAGYNGLLEGLPMREVAEGLSALTELGVEGE